MEDVGLWPTRDDDPLGPDSVIANEIATHRVVLNEISAQARRNDSLADGVIPARDVPDDRKREAPRADDERNDRVHLHVRERDRRTIVLQARKQLRLHVTRAAVVPACHPWIEAGPAR